MRIFILVAILRR